MIQTSIQVWYLNHLNRPSPRVTTTVLFSTWFGPLHASSPQQRSIRTAHKGCNDVPRCVVLSIPCMWNKTVRPDGRHSTTLQHHNATLTPPAHQQRTHPAQTVDARHHPLKGALCHTVRKQEPMPLQAPRPRNFSAPPRTPHILLTRIPEHSQNIQHDRWVAWRLGCSISDAVRERVNSRNALNVTNTRHTSYTIQTPTR